MRTTLINKFHGTEATVRTGEDGELSASHIRLRGRNAGTPDRDAICRPSIGVRLDASSIRSLHD